MNIPLKKHQADWIAEQVSSGRYQTELEAIEDAIAAQMREDEAEWQATRERMRERLRQGQEDIEHGRVVVADDAFWDDIHARIDRVAATKQA
jgi:Arc/MetJ-type ribon-helix-helix transcriptional regulator